MTLNTTNTTSKLLLPSFAPLRLCAFALNYLWALNYLCSFYFIFLFILLFTPLSTYAVDVLSQGFFAEGITVDLREPVYTEGVLTTTQGGIIQGPNLRIQATNICYTRKVCEGTAICCIKAEDSLMIEMGDYVFIGDSLEYDFQKREGIIYNGRTGVEPWFFGGEFIDLKPDGSYVIHNGFATTSENVCSDWEITSEDALLENKSLLTAKRVKFKILKIPVLWIPTLNLNLDSIFNSPIKYRFSFGGSQGTRFGITYEVFSWERWETFLRLDCNLKRGLGGGVEVYYLSEDHKTFFHSINYFARDTSLFNPHEKTRYRFEGRYQDLILDDRVSIELTYDKISDIDMPSDYYDKGIDLDTAERTELHIRNQQDYWLTNFWTRVRLNPFQTIKQELPAVETRLRPIVLGNTGIVSDSIFRAAYLDFDYTDHLINVSDYSAIRLAANTNFYRPFLLGPVTLTPEVGGVGIYYGNSPQSNSQFLAVGTFGCNLNTHLYNYYSWGKHVIEPYVDYTYYTYPTSNPNDHYIFDITDGWYRVSMLTYGIRNTLYTQTSKIIIARLFNADLFTHTFFNTHTFKRSTPKVYAQVSYFLSERLKHTIDTAWDFEQNQLDHFNFRADWTLSTDCAVAAEYRHRDSFCWRKVDNTNFVLESFRNIKALRASSLSDRRDTVLFYFFYRFHPNWVYEMKARHGWNRLREPQYTEYEIDVVTTLSSGWRIKCSYQHYQSDDRISLGLSLGLQRPTVNNGCQLHYFE